MYVYNISLLRLQQYKHFYIILLHYLFILWLCFMETHYHNIAKYVLNYVEFNKSILLKDIPPWFFEYSLKVNGHGVYNASGIVLH